MDNISKRLQSFTEMSENDTPDFVDVCKRINNTKRNFLFINKYQGSPLPARPMEVLSMMNVVSAGVEAKIRSMSSSNRQIEDEKCKSVAVIGFCETATALSQVLAFDLAARGFKVKYFGNTTRFYREADNSEFYFEFDESHSHAIEQMFIGPKSVDVETVVVFDDELTTGKTALKLIKGLKEKWPTVKNWIVSSILNWMNSEDTDEYKRNGVEFVGLFKGYTKSSMCDFGNIELKMPKKVDSENAAFSEKDVLRFEMSDWEKASKGTDIVSRAMFSLNMFYTVFGDMKDFEVDEKVLIVGSEEFMFMPLMLALSFKTYIDSVKEESCGCCESCKGEPEVYFQPSTRCPICVSSDDGYYVKNGVQVRSPYRDYTSFIYNLDRYDRVIAITDSADDELCLKWFSDVRAAFVKYGLHPDKFYGYRFGEVHDAK